MNTRNLHHNTTVDVVYDSFNLDKIVVYANDKNSAIWSGHYLAAMCHKYNVTADASDLAVIRNLVAGFDRGTKVSGSSYLVRWSCPKSDPLCEKSARGVKYNGTEEWSDWIWVGHTSRD
jgi:hypothetical protein